MRELLERYKADIVDGIPESDLMLYCPGLHGLGKSLLDRSKNALNGTMFLPVWKRLPSGLYVLYFDGIDDKVTFGASALLCPTSAITFELWFNSSQNTVTCALYSSFAADITGILVYLNAGTRLRFYLENVRQDLGSSATDVTINAWHHAAFTYDSAVALNNFIYYIEGVPVRTITTANAITYTGTKSAGLSQNVGGGVTYFKGSISLVRLYDRALSATEILRHFTRERRLFGV